MESSATPWLVLVPVKSTIAGKSRILLEPSRRAALARAMALDTVTAIASAQRVARVVALVETADDARLLTAVPGVTAHHATVRGLNESIREALALPELDGRPIAVLPADLPSLRPGELDAALAAAQGLRLAVVPDRQGTGTTLLAARSRRDLRPRYGVGSFAAHLAAGAVALAVPAGSGLRRDVDVLADLRTADGPLTCAEAGELVDGAAAG